MENGQRPSPSIIHSITAFTVATLSFCLNLTTTITSEFTHAFDARFVHRFPLRFPYRPRAALVAYMKQILFALAILATPAHAFNGTLTVQYGPPIRYPNPRDWGPDEHDRRLPPPRGGYPIVRDPCIAYGQCGPRRPRMPPFPDRYDLYEDEQ